MFRGVKWFVTGAVAAALAITGGSIVLRTAADREAALERQNERLRQEREALVRRAEQLEQERKQLAEVIERLGVERRVAEVDVLQQHTDPSGRVLQTVIRLTEIGRDGQPLPERVFGVPGHVPHFDALVIKFEDDYVGRGDQLRGTSLALFRRIYGETQAPDDGYWLGQPGDVPDVYRVAPEPTEFEVNLWREFWSYATDPAKARTAGVRVAQGEAVYAPVSPGEHWQLTLEADGGLNLIKQDGYTSVPVAGPPPNRPRPIEPSSDTARLHAPPPLNGNP